MTNFTKEKLEIEYADKNHWALKTKIEYSVGAEDSLEKIIVPVGYKTRFSSIPFCVGVFFPLGINVKPSIVYEYITINRLYSEKEALRIYNESMKVLKISKFKRFTIITLTKIIRKVKKWQILR